jgi:hypothetical protein
VEENQVKKSVYNLLYNLEQTGDILWFERLNSGVIKSGESYIWMCRPGTSDFVVLYMNKSRNLGFLFLEVKSTNKPRKPRKGKQEDFSIKYSHKHIDLQYEVVNCVKQASDKILSLAFDRLTEINPEF